MKKFILFPFFLLLINFCNAQVTNDSCLSAKNIGFIPNGSIGLICFNGSINVPLIDSTDFAIANFPYPNISIVCNGYTPVIAFPGKDIWYRFTTNCDFTFQVENSDTVHLSFWFGDTCSNLIPIQCYTVPAGLTYNHTLSGLGGHTIFLQVSGPNISVNTKFTICFSGTLASCFPSYTFSPTPTQCFVYDVQTTNCSSAQSNDGTASINLTQGNSPFSCLWNDGFNGFVRSNLASGIYYFTITDINGCSESDSISISIANAIIIDNQGSFYKVKNNKELEILSVLFQKNKLSDRDLFFITNNLGVEIFSSRIFSLDKLTFNYSKLTNGIYYLHFKAQNPIPTIKFSVIR